MGSSGSAVGTRERPATLPGYANLGGPVRVLYPARLEDRAQEVQGYLGRGSGEMAALLGVEAPSVCALLVGDEDWPAAPRENEHPYPRGLPYFTRSVDPPALVLPERLAPVFGPRTDALLPLTVWHELAHAFVLSEPLVRTPAWLQEFVPQAASAAVARRAGLPLGEHLRRIDGDPGFTVRGFGGRAGAEDQMRFQNLLLLLGAAALEEFGEDPLSRLLRALREEDDVVGESRAEELFADALGPGGRGWLQSRQEF